MYITRKVLPIIQIILVVALLPFLIIPYTFVCNAIHISLALILLAFVLMTYAYYTKHMYTVNKIEYIISIFLAILLFIMLSASAIFNSPLFTDGLFSTDLPSFFCKAIDLWKYIVYIPALCFSLYICCLAGVHVCLKSGSNSNNNQDSKKNQLCYILCLLSITILSIIYLCTAYPGIFTDADVAVVWDAAVSHYWDDWHTLGYLLYVLLCSQFGDSIFATLVIDTLIGIALNAYILRVLKDYHINSMKAYTVLLIVSGTYFVYLGYMVKDVVYAFGILALVAGLFRITFTQKIAIIDYVVLCGISLFATLCRHAGIICVLLSLIVVALYYLIKRNFAFFRRLIAIACFHVACYFIIHALLFNSCIPNPSYIKYGTPMAMIGAAVTHDVEFEPEDIEKLEQVMPLERWGECYHKYWADSIARRWGTIGSDIDKVQELVEQDNYGDFLIKMNAKLLLQHPFIYCEALFDMNTILWEIGLPADYSSVSVAQLPCYDYVYYSTFYPFTHGFANFLDNQPLTNALFYRGGASLFLLILYGCVFVIKKKPAYLFCLFPVYINSLLLSITIPAQDTRYVLPAIESALFMTAILFFANSKKNNTHPN